MIFPPLFGLERYMIKEDHTFCIEIVLVITHQYYKFYNQTNLQNGMHINA